MKSLDAIFAGILDPSRWHTTSCTACGTEIEIAEGQRDEICRDCLDGRRERRPPTRSEALKAVGTPDAYLIPFTTPETWPADPRRAGEPIEDWKGGERWCLTFAGVTQAGKTMLGTEIFYRNLSSARSAWWVSASELVSLVFGDFGPELKRQATERLFDVDLLFLDELGKAHNGGGWDVILRGLYHRHAHLSRTITTTNRRLAKRQGDRDLGLADQDPGLFERLKKGLIVGMQEQWR